MTSHHNPSRSRLMRFFPPFFLHVRIFLHEVDYAAAAAAAIVSRTAPIFRDSKFRPISEHRERSPFRLHVAGTYYAGTYYEWYLPLSSAPPILIVSSLENYYRFASKFADLNYLQRM